MTESRSSLWGLTGRAGAAKPGLEERLRVLNATRGTVLATQLEVAKTSAKRNKGLLGRKGLAEGEGLWITPCESVHTFFMQFAIDLVYLDRRHRVVKVRSNVGPWRLSACLVAHSILELPSGTVRATQTSRGDRLEFLEQGSENCPATAIPDAIGGEPVL